MLLNKGNLKIKESSKAIVENLLHLNLARKGFSSKYGDAPPLRSELFSAEQMTQHGKTLAGRHKLLPGRAPDQLLARLAENETVLVGVHKLMTEAVVANRQITPAGEWLLDNFYLIEEQIRTAKRHLPKPYSRELPRLQGGPSAGLPRVYDIALEVISHGDGRVDPESLTSFVAAYQTVTPLNLGELWALPIMLRLALIENLRRVAARVATDRIGRNLADTWADELIETAEKDPKNLIVVIADMARSNPPMESAFVAELTRRLQGQGPSLALPINWVEQHLSESGWTIPQMVQAENQKQAANQVSLSNSIGSLRYLSALDWRKFVEDMSIVERILREDPDGAYPGMEFATRDAYRHVVERIAKYSGHAEHDVARKAIALTKEGAAVQGAPDRAAHVGFFLIGDGTGQLEDAVEARLPFRQRMGRAAHRSPGLLYVGGIVVITLLLSGLLVAKANSSPVEPWVLILVGCLSIVASSQLAVALMNWLVTLLMTPDVLPRMDFSNGIPSDSRTLVVVPTMLATPENVEELIEGLEVRFLANRDKNLDFGLLTDFTDAGKETMPEDEALLQQARRGIEALNERYKSSGAGFFLFHRPRLWNLQERVWMGYERKRGKLGDLNALLRGGAPDAFSLIVGDTSRLNGVKYVITLDTDTQLPRDAARELVGALAHPLNRAGYCEPVERICKGYGILQPRVGSMLPGGAQSRYARLFGSEPGIDPYTRAVSDVYQDLFGEGSFIGKGIYDVDAFERALKGRFPDNRILSHDLVEGCYARSGLLTDVQVFEEYPSRYSADVSRRHRWIRGDWQLLRWLLPWVPGAAGTRRNPIGALNRWKLFDNLRRSLVPVAQALLLLISWAYLRHPGVWTLAIVGIILGPAIFACMMDLLRKPKEVLWAQHMTSTLRCASNHLAQSGFTLTCLPYEAYFSLDAILRTLWRTMISRRRLLEWSVAGEGDRNKRNSLATSWRTMWIGPAVALVTLVYLTAARPTAWLVAWPIWALWAMSPSIAWWISRPAVSRPARITAAQTVYLRKLARKTWNFFETFVGPEDNWVGSPGTELEFAL